MYSRIRNNFEDKLFSTAVLTPATARLYRVGNVIKQTTRKNSRDSGDFLAGKNKKLDEKTVNKNEKNSI